MVEDPSADHLHRDLERLRFWQGQRMTARDFNEQARIDAQLRWWHNRALHDIPGVLEGFMVEVRDTGHVAIAKGLAVDGIGRELLLPEAVVEAIPAQVPPAGLVLLARLQEGAPARPGSSRACLPGGVVSARRPVEFFWQPAIEPGGYGYVRLGRLYRDTAGNLVFDDERHFGSPVARPRVITGSTVPGATDWDFYSYNPAAPALNNSIGLQVHIDTSAAGFTRTPCYFAWLQSDYSLDSANSRTELADLAALLLLEHIDETSVHGFMFRLIALMAVPSQNLGALLNVIPKLKPYVCWIGIESGPSAPSD